MESTGHRRIMILAVSLLGTLVVMSVTSVVGFLTLSKRSDQIATTGIPLITTLADIDAEMGGLQTELATALAQGGLETEGPRISERVHHVSEAWASFLAPIDLGHVISHGVVGDGVADVGQGHDDGHDDADAADSDDDATAMRRPNSPPPSDSRRLLR